MEFAQDLLASRGLLCKTLKCKVVYIFPQLKKRQKNPTSYSGALQHELSDTFKEGKETRAGKLYGYIESMPVSWTFHMSSFCFKFLKGRGRKLVFCRLVFQ
ncbi:unnamed protein product [Rangifer tarandus platyrhynchus]|uniref:Uncharacterized protein n=1 Tax=Rangifer tarandus platyrhynchus TaxID=3082113 RepID=A0AC59YM07_RANTA